MVYCNNVQFRALRINDVDMCTCDLPSVLYLVTGRMNLKSLGQYLGAACMPYSVVDIVGINCSN